MPPLLAIIDTLIFRHAAMPRLFSPPAAALPLLPPPRRHCRLFSPLMPRRRHYELLLPYERCCILMSHLRRYFAAAILFTRRQLDFSPAAAITA